MIFTNIHSEEPEPGGDRGMIFGDANGVKSSDGGDGDRGESKGSDRGGLRDHGGVGSLSPAGCLLLLGDGEVPRGGDLGGGDGDLSFTGESTYSMIGL